MSTTRRTPSKGRKELQKLVDAMDALLPALQDKPSKCADVLIEKSALLGRIAAIEADEHADEQTARIAELESAQKSDTTKIAELTAENSRLRIAANTPVIQHRPDPEHATTRSERDGLKQERDGLKQVVAGLIDAISDPVKVETIVKAAVALFPTFPKIGDILQESTSTDLKWLNWLPKFWSLEQDALNRHRGAADKRIDRLCDEVLAARFPLPAKVTPVIPDWIPRTQEERDALGAAKLRAIKGTPQYV